MKKFKFRLQVVLDMRQNELEQRQMEMAKILNVLQEQIGRKQGFIQAQNRNNQEMENLYHNDSLDIMRVEGHRDFGLKLNADIINQDRIIANTKAILELKQKEVNEAHKKVEVLKKLKEKQEEQYYKDFLAQEVKETDDLTTSRFRLENGTSNS